MGINIGKNTSMKHTGREWSRLLCFSPEQEKSTYMKPVESIFLKFNNSFSPLILMVRHSWTNLIMVRLNLLVDFTIRCFMHSFNFSFLRWSVPSCRCYYPSTIYYAHSCQCDQKNIKPTSTNQIQPHLSLSHWKEDPYWEVYLLFFLLDTISDAQALPVSVWNFPAKGYNFLQ